ncbi:MAG: HD-GYP domain-containing protein [Spirochaetaceae bacterium]|jgi:HD-GYP domain-containing protein (c-di-GMP phosphodiesterase class II)|nr:HD-GYP domain-containing protein [Spirochaetaceae bacterium]
MRQFKVKDITPGCFFSEPVYLDGSFILTAPEMPFSPELARALTEWNFKEVVSGGEIREDSPGESASALSGQNNARLEEARQFYAAFLRYAESLFLMTATNRELSFRRISERVKTICDLSWEQRRHLLQVIIKEENTERKNYLASHAVKSAIVSIIIGTYIKLPPHRLIELGVAALLHEAGMSALPSGIYMSGRELTPQERKSMLTHPVLGFNILKSFDFPLTVSVAALEHHERENGTGYPQRLTGDKISLYAKIIAVACSYEALTSSRPHRDAKDGYSGMLDLLKNEGKQYDDTIIKALVFSLSIYPIGLYVLLSNGVKGVVTDVNPENPRYPMVQVFDELAPDGKSNILETSRDGIHIVRPLRQDETGLA